MNAKRTVRKAVLILIVVIFLCVILSCPNPLSEESLILMQDSLSPVITITSPAEGTSYASFVEVRGAIADQASESTAGEIRSLKFEVMASTVAGDAEIDGEGAFSFNFSTVGLSGTITVRIEAEDRNGNIATLEFYLVDEGAVPSFSAVPRNRATELVWDEVAMTESYILHYAAGDEIPSVLVGTHIENAVSPCLVSELENGIIHSFLLQAKHGDGTSSISSVITAIPLSEHTLLPRATPECGAVCLSWPSVPGADGFEILRAKDGGPFTPVTTVSDGNEYRDTGVPPWVTYSYCVRPDMTGGIISAATDCWAGELSVSPLESVWADFAIYSSGNSISISGDYAFVGAFSDFAGMGYTSILYVYDIGSSDTIERNSAISLYEGSIGQPTPELTDIALWNDYAVLTSGNNGSEIAFVNISEPLSPFLEYTLDGLIYDTFELAIAGDTAHVAAGDTGLKELSLGTPVSTSAPTGKAYDPTGSEPVNGVAVRDGYAYVAAGAAGLEIVDLSTYSLYRQVLPTGGGDARSVVLAGDYAYVALYNGGMMIVDIEPPGSASVTASLVPTGSDETVRISVSGDYAYLSDESSGLHVVDISDPANPRLFNTGINTNYPDESVVHDGRFFLTDESVLKVFNITPFPVLDFEAEVLSGGGELIAVSDKYMVSFDDSAAPVIRICDRGTGSILDTVSFDESWMVTVAEFYADMLYLAAFNTADFTFPGRIEAYKIGPGGVLSLTDSINTGAVSCLAFEGDYAYFGSLGQNLQVIDITDTSNLQLIYTLFVEKVIGQTARYGEYLLFLGGNASGPADTLFAADLSEPAVPVIVDSWAVTGDANSIAVSGDYAYLGITGAADRDLQAVNISNPESLSDGPYIVLSSGGYESAVIGAILFIRTDTWTVQIVDLSEPAELRILGTYDTGFNLEDGPLLLWGDRLYTTASGDILEFRISSQQ